MTPFYNDLIARIRSKGGLFNAHLHLDRAGTLSYLSECLHSDLSTKHARIDDLYQTEAFKSPDFKTRICYYVKQLVHHGTKRADTFIDVVNLSILDFMLDLRESVRNDMDLRIGAYNPCGFRENDSETLARFIQGVEKSHFIGVLPERDDKAVYPDHIGFIECCRRMLELSVLYDKPVHFHIDQKNDGNEFGSELLIKAVEALRIPAMDSGAPRIWFIHMISPSQYAEGRFMRLVDGLIQNRIGVICCPSAAISMRQDRSVMSPTYNSIARVDDMVRLGVPVRIGSDNIADMFLPSTTANLMDEIFVLSNAIRLYDLDILAGIAAGALG